MTFLHCGHVFTDTPELHQCPFDGKKNFCIAEDCMCWLPHPENRNAGTCARIPRVFVKY